MYRNEAVEKYILFLLEKSTVEAPVWNVEKTGKSNTSKWNYVDGCMIKALLDFGEISGDDRITGYAMDFIDHRVNEDGSIEGYNKKKYNLDDINAGKTLFTLYRLTGREKYKKALDAIYEQVKEQPRTFEGSFWHKLIYPNQVWLDGFYMVQPFYMEYETAFNGHENYDDIFKQFKTARLRMKDRETGLYFHGYDASRSIFWCDPSTGLSRNFWLRSMGWFVMALIDTLEQCEQSGFEKECDMLKGMFRDLVDALLKFKTENNFWYQVVDKGGTPGNYEETSGTAIMAYALLKGARTGLLPAEYAKTGQDVFESICRRYIDENGRMLLGGICLVAGLGPDNDRRRDGSVDYYLSEPVVENDAKGVGPFLLAYTELLRLYRDKEL
ncbi:MAG: glycoside hydrolase family 88 protein [Lachnospiraceae bacterium]|nr:glycoside hydrolase family 88 protein [Lachnospiraceae bacterium]